MQNIKKYFMTLALLLTAVTGAWAQSTFGVKEITADMLPASWSTDNSAVTADDLAKLGFMEVTKDAANTWTGAPQKGTVRLVYTLCESVNWVDGEGGYESTYSSRKIFYSCLDGQKIFITTELTEWSLTPDADKKVWTLAKMPANDIELQVEYFAESNLFLSKDALSDKANISVLNGSTAVEFDAEGKSTATVTEGNTVTVKYNGTKKILGMKVAKAAGNTYLKWDADQKKLVATEIPATANKVQNSTSNVEWAGTYVVEDDVTISGEIKLTGDVELIIKDGVTLTVTKIIHTQSGASLSVYGQTQMSGELNVTNSGSDAIFAMNSFAVHSCKVTATSPAGGGGGVYNATIVNVYGGSLEAEYTGASNGHGIQLRSGGSMNIYGGEVKAVGKGNNADYSYGIKSSNNSTGVATVTVYGGKLWTECAGNKALSSVITLTKDASYTGKIEYSSDKSAWSETVNADAKYVRAGY